MSGIFEYVLLLISVNDSNTINNVIKSPITIFTEDMQFIECDENFSFIDITINLSISSAKNHARIDALFDDNGGFVSKSQVLLSNFFQVEINIVNIINISESINVHHLQDVSYNKDRVLLTSFKTSELFVAVKTK